MGSTLVTPGAREAGRADLPGFPPWAPSPAAAPADSWWHHRLCSAPEPAPEELVGGGVEPRVPQPGPALSEPASPPPKVTPSTPAGSRLTPPQRAQSRRSPSVMVKRSTTQTTVSRMRSSTHEPSTSSSRSSPNASCSSRLARMARRVEAAAVEKFLQEHRFSGIDHCRRAGRWPLSRRCCPLSLAAQRGDVSTVILLLKQGADPLLPLTLLRRQQATGAWQQDARRLLERAAGETGRGLAAESGALWSIFHVVDPWAESGRSRCSASWSAAIPCCAGLGRGRPDRRRGGVAEPSAARSARGLSRAVLRMRSGAGEARMRPAGRGYVLASLGRVHFSFGKDHRERKEEYRSPRQRVREGRGAHTATLASSCSPFRAFRKSLVATAGFASDPPWERSGSSGMDTVWLLTTTRTQFGRPPEMDSGQGLPPVLYPLLSPAVTHQSVRRSIGHLSRLSAQVSGSSLVNLSQLG
ncbi:unnamed protein product [Prorocentrum cordatum]|uniref:Uncharacterized protein n=1 Tax=Prorocentrum cordatum TaxID=2364126 RepID=A0ABN9UX99_9DINO|nr:unnamed protein product [Polarella glacialis]